jgi:hypothetical protein
MEIFRIEADDEILSTLDVMRQLRPHLELVAAGDGTAVLAVAGYRIMVLRPDLGRR